MGKADVLFEFARKLGVAGLEDLPAPVQQLVASGRYNEAAEEMARLTSTQMTATGGAGGIPPKGPAVGLSFPEAGGEIGPVRRPSVRVLGAGNHRPSGKKDAPTYRPEPRKKGAPTYRPDPMGDAIREILNQKQRNAAWAAGAGLAGAGLLYERFYRGSEGDPAPPEEPSDEMTPEEYRQQLLRQVELSRRFPRSK
jgi:hypothetical protein